jgi:hydroxymethylpyrimidine/phosphomethylpyrimidine kinase
MMRTALSVAGFDPTSGAGITADIKVFRSLKVHGVGIVSSITSQNTLGLQHAEPLSRYSFRRQMDSLLEDISPHAAKTGMLYDKRIIRSICSEVDSGRIRNLVVDPVILSSTGKSLIKKDALAVLISELIPRSYVITPNISEAAHITGTVIKGVDDMYHAAEIFVRLGAKNVVIKGGHLKKKAIDVFYDGNKFKDFKSDKIKGWFHGTGCVLSAAITAYIATGKEVQDSVKSAKAYTKRAIERSYKAGRGMRLLMT